MFFVKDNSIAKRLGAGIEMLVEDDASVLDVIAKADELIRQKGSFPHHEYHSLLHMVYNPITDRFYMQVGLHVYTTPGHFYNILDNVQHELLDGMTITLTPFAGCISDFEKPINYEKFIKALSRSQRIKNS